MKTRFKTHQTKHFFFCFLIATLLAACTKNNVNPDSQLQGSLTSNQVNSPANLNLLFGYRSGNLYPTRLVLPITKIGNQSVSIKTVFDTGSEGLILTAQNVVSPNLITSNGINLNGKDQTNINGITITSHKDSASYGNAPNERTYYGQIAYGSIVIGDASAHVTTRPMSFLLIYKGIVKATGKAAPIDADLDGICGVAFQSLSTQDLVTARKDLRSPFAYINYGGGLLSGFKLQSYSAFYNVAVSGQTTAGSLLLKNAPLLQVGLTSDIEHLFTVQQKHLANSGLTYSPLVDGKFNIDGKPFDGEVLFDSGTPQGVSIFYPESLGNQVQTLNNGTTISFTSLEGYNYTYMADKLAKITTLTPAATIGRSIIGLPFFTNNSFLIDYTNHLVGMERN